MATKRLHDSQRQSDSGGSVAAKKVNIKDSYCWLCHQADANVPCSTCIRSLHEQCIGSKAKTHMYRCEACTKSELANSQTATKYSRLDQFNGLLKYAVKRLLEDDEFVIFNKDYFKNYKNKLKPRIVNVLSLDDIAKKVNNSGYVSTVDFLNDIKWIQHNVTIAANPYDMPIVKRMEWLCTKEMYDIEICSECYQRSNTKTDWFTDVCNPPHLLVWARVNSHYNYAPAKVLATNTSTKRIDVRFFGDHEMAKISPTDCYLYSEENPNQKSDEKNQLKLMAMSKEVETYITNISNRFSCDFIKADPMTSFNESKIAQHLKNMITGDMRLPSNFKLVSKPAFLNKSVCRRASFSFQSPQPKPKPKPKPKSTPKTHQPSTSTAVKTPLAVSNPTPTPNRSSNPFVVLDNCDHMLTKENVTIVHQYANDKMTANNTNGLESDKKSSSESHMNTKSSDTNSMDNRSPGETSIKSHHTRLSTDHVDEDTFEMSNTMLDANRIENISEDGEMINSPKVASSAPQTEDTHHSTGLTDEHENIFDVLEISSDDDDYDIKPMITTPPEAPLQQNAVLQQQPIEWVNVAEVDVLNEHVIGNITETNVDSGQKVVDMSSQSLNTVESMKTVEKSTQNMAMEPNFRDIESSGQKTSSGLNQNDAFNAENNDQTQTLAGDVMVSSNPIEDGEHSNSSDNIVQTNEDDWEGAFHVLHSSIEKWQQKIKLLENEAHKKEQMHIELQKRSIAMIEHLEKEHRELKATFEQQSEDMLKLKKEQDERIKKAIEDTKTKKWCWNCHNEILHQLNITMCKECLDASWVRSDERVQRSSNHAAEQLENENRIHMHGLIADLMDDATENGQPQRIQSDIEQQIEEPHDPLSVDLEGF